MSAAAHHALQRDAAPPETTDTDTGAGEFGMWVFIASELLFFGALLLTYAYGRAQWPDGFAAASRRTDVLLGTLNTAVLLSGSLCAALAAAANGAKRHRLAARLLGGTAVLGVAFLAVKGIEYRKEWAEGLFPGPAFTLGSGHAVPQGAQAFFAFYFIATGLHALHVAGGVALMAWLACRRRRLDDGGSDEPPQDFQATVHVGGLYWHFVDVIWVVLYPLLYLVNRHA